jgi:hypothetical protein
MYYNGYYQNITAKIKGNLIYSFSYLILFVLIEIAKKCSFFSSCFEPETRNKKSIFIKTKE